MMAAPEQLPPIEKLKAVVAGLLAVPKSEIEAAEKRRLRKAPRRKKG